MPTSRISTIVLGPISRVEGHLVDNPSHHAIHEKVRTSINDAECCKDGPQIVESEAKAAGDHGDFLNEDDDADSENNEAIVITGSDASKYLLPMRDDFQPALTFRSLVLASVLSAFQAVLSQIYTAS